MDGVGVSGALILSALEAAQATHWGASVVTTSTVGAGETAIALGDEDGWHAIFLLGDTLRADARTAIHSLNDAGLATFLLSGDAAPAVQRVAIGVGIDPQKAAWSARSPEQKHEVIKAMQAEGHVVVMVGDGINDAPVLAQAQVSVAMAGGADLARSHADVVLLGERLMALPEGIVLARRTMRIVGALQCIGGAFGHGGVGDSLDGGHRHGRQFAAGRSQRTAPAGTRQATMSSMDSGMDILYLLVPMSILLVFVIGAIFWWSLTSGQFDDLDGPGYRVLMDDDTTKKSDDAPESSQ